MPLLSVILPVFNNAPTIAQAVRSVLNQTFRDFEVIVLDDGSTDETLTVLKQFDDPRLRIIKGERNLGLPKRLNQGLDECTGLYIARMDADDISFPERFDKQIAYLQNNSEVDLLATRAVVFKDTEILRLLPFYAAHADIVSQPWNCIPMPHPTWMAQADWIKKHRYSLPEVWRAEDQDLLLRAHKTSIYACLPEVLLCYRQGNPDKTKLTLARRSLLRAQVSYFSSHKQYLETVLSVCVFITKSLYDGIKPHLAKKSASASLPPDVLTKVKTVLSS